MNTYANQYQQNQIATATPEQIMLMLYDGAIRFARRAMAANDNVQTVEKLHCISKCMAIIVEFSNTLNHDIGGEIAENLDALYNFMIRELNAARNDQTNEHLKNVEKLLADLRITWGQAVEINKQEQAGARGLHEEMSVRAAGDKGHRSFVAAG